MVSHLAISSVLIKQEGMLQKSIYYVSRVLHNTKTRYTSLEKVMYILMILVRRLCLYFQAHMVAILTYQLIRPILHQPKILG